MKVWLSSRRLAGVYFQFDFLSIKAQLKTNEKNEKSFFYKARSYKLFFNI
jgi:hypothetical protein